MVFKDSLLVSFGLKKNAWSATVFELDQRSIKRRRAVDAGDTVRIWDHRYDNLDSALPRARPLGPCQEVNKRPNIKQVDYSILVDVSLQLKQSVGKQVDKGTHIQQIN